MFMLRMFQTSSSSNVDKSSEHASAVVDVNEQSKGEQLNLKDNLQTVIAVSDKDDGFAEVAIRPLTYAEVAALAATASERGESSKQYLGDLDDVLYDKDDDDDDDENAVDEADDALVDSMYSNASNEEETPSSSRVYTRRASTNQDVISEMEYGERAQVVFRGADRKHLTKKKIVHQTPLIESAANPRKLAAQALSTRLIV